MPKEAVIGPSEITISLVDESKDMRVFMGAITGFQLCRIYETSNVDHRRRDNEILRMNVRRRLTEKPTIIPDPEEDEDVADFRTMEKKTSIVTAMRKTIDDDVNRYRFLSYNNGVTIVCSKFEEKGVHKKKISNPQIVNGGQTTELLFSYYQNGNFDERLQEVKLPIKIVETKGKTDSTFLEIARDVATMVNHQNPTNTRDLFANDEIFEDIRAYYESLEHKIFLGVKEGEWELLVSQNKDGFNTKVVKYIDTNEWQDTSTKRHIDIEDDFAQNRWSLLGGGSLVTALKREMFNAKRSIFHTNEDQPSYLPLDPSFTIYEETELPFVLVDTQENLLREVLFGKIMMSELTAIKSKMNAKKRAFKVLTDESQAKRRKNSLQAILVPSYCLLAVNEALRLRCQRSDLASDLNSDAARNALLSFILGDNKSEKTARFNNLPFFTKQSRLFVKANMGGWDEHKAFSDSSTSILRKRNKSISRNLDLRAENSIMDIIEFTCNNLATVIYDEGVTFPGNWNSKKTELQSINKKFIERIKSDTEKRRLMAIDLGDNLKSKQQKGFEEQLLTLRRLIGLGA